MGGPISVVSSDIFMNKMERDIVLPIALNLYKSYVDDIFAKCKKNKPDDLYNALDNYHPNINLTVEVNPKKFLDTEIISNSNLFETKVFHKDRKLTTHWSSAVPKRYKRNSILGDLHRAKEISSYFVDEVEYIRKRYKKAGYPHRFIEHVINDFMKTQDDKLVPDWLFDVREKVFLRLPYCQQNEEDVKKFINHLTIITKEKFQFIVLWKTCAIQSLFPIKDKVCHTSCVIYQGICSCGATYIGETVRNASIRWSEHNNINGNSEPAKHIAANTTHAFSWKVISVAPKNAHEHKLLEAMIIRLHNPSLNEQLETKSLILFRNGVTWDPFSN